MNAAPIILAAGNSLEGLLIWLIIIAIWGVGQVLNRSKNRSVSRRAPPPSTDMPPRPMEDEMRELFETITGQQRPAPPVEVIPPPVAASRRPPQPQRRKSSAPQPALSPPSPRVSAATAGPLESVPMRLDVMEFGHASPPSLTSGHTSMDIAASMTIPAQLMNIPAMQIGLSYSVSRREAAEITPALLRDKKAFRRMMLSRIILGPPRAMDPIPLEGAARN